MRIKSCQTWSTQNSAFEITLSRSCWSRLANAKHFKARGSYSHSISCRVCVADKVRISVSQWHTSTNIAQNPPPPGLTHKRQIPCRDVLLGFDISLTFVTWLAKNGDVFSMQMIQKMELQATKFSSVTVQRTLPGSLRIWFLFLRNTRYPTAFISGTLSWEYPSSKTWRTACMAAAKCWLFCLTTTSPAISAGKSWTWPSRGGQIREIRQWFLFWSTSLRKRDCLTLWGKRICWILRSTRRSKIGRRNCCRPYSEAKLLVLRGK